MSEHGPAIEIVLNGRPVSCAADQSIAALLRDLGLRAEVLAVERNRELVPRAWHASTLLRPGDRLEVVSLVGGG